MGGHDVVSPTGPKDRKKPFAVKFRVNAFSLL